MGKSNLAEAEESIGKGIKILDNRKLKPYISIGAYILGALQAHSRQTEKAIPNLKAAEDNFERMQMNFWLGKTCEAMAALT